MTTALQFVLRVRVASVPILLAHSTFKNHYFAARRSNPQFFRLKMLIMSYLQVNAR